MPSVSSRRIRAWLLACWLGLAAHGVTASELRFRAQEIENDLGIGYAVSLIDMNADARLDILVVDTTRVVWYEQPAQDPRGSTWVRHALIQDQTLKDNVCIAPYDIDEDGRPDFALGADWRPIDTLKGGTIQWLSPGPTASDRWNVHPIGEEPTVHRMRWADLDGDGRSELIVVPLMGRGSTRPLWAESAVRILAYHIPEDPRNDPWIPVVINEDLHVTHNFWPTDLNGDSQTDLLVVSYEGVSLLERRPDGAWERTLIGEGNQATSPDRGASEIKHGYFAAHKDYIATIEPWHGFQVVVYTRPELPDADPKKTQGKLWTRHLLDEELKWGHAVWCADLDGDPDQELIIGVRDNRDDQVRCGVRIYDPNNVPNGKWDRQLVDPGGVSVEDLAAADLDGDGRNDIVAVGRQTKNVRIYWNELP